jgi:hypothetical protein
MLGRRSAKIRPLPSSFLRWQVALRRHTMQHRNGAPHAGVAPVLTVFAPGVGHGMSSHSIICGVLPAPELLDVRTREFRELYERHLPEGARAVYDAGLAHLEGYYTDPSDFDPATITTLLPEDGHVVRALRLRPECSLLFYVFDLHDQSEIGRLRCTQLHCVAEIHADGPVYENVWWHNTLFHGAADGHVVIAFRHLSSHDTGFGALDPT